MGKFTRLVLAAIAGLTLGHNAYAAPKVVYDGKGGCTLVADGGHVVGVGVETTCGLGTKESPYFKCCKSGFEYYSSVIATKADFGDDANTAETRDDQPIERAPLIK